MPNISRRCWIAYLVVFCVALGVYPSVILAQDKETSKTKLLDLVPVDHMMVLVMNRSDRMLTLMKTLDPDMELDFEKESFLGKTGLDFEVGNLLILIAPDTREGELKAIEVFKIKEKAQFMDRHQVKENQDGAMEGMDPNGNQVYVRIIDDHVMFSEDQLGLLNLQPGKMGMQMMKEMNDSPLEKMESYDAFGQMNMKNTKAYLKKLLDYDEIRKEMNAGGPGLPMAWGDVAVTLMEKWMDMMMNDTQSILMAANITQEGMLLDGAVKFREASVLAQALAKPGKTPTVNRLPKIPFFFLMAGDFSDLGGTELFQEFMKDLKTGLKDIEVDDQMGKELLSFYVLLADLMQDFIKETEPVQSMEMIVPAPRKVDIRNVFASLTVMTLEKPDQYMDAYAKLVNGMKKGIDEMSIADQITMTFQRDLTEVNGKKVSVLHMAPKAQGLNPAGNMNKRHLVPGKDAILEMNGGDFSLLAKGIKAMDGNSGMEQDELVQLMKRESLSEANVMGILNTQKLAEAAMDLIVSFTGERAPRIEGLQPMLMSTSQGQGWMRARSTLPVKSFYKIQKTMEEMQQGTVRPGAM